VPAVGKPPHFTANNAMMISEASPTLSVSDPRLTPHGTVEGGSASSVSAIHAFSSV
jgi:hypothetical protein